MQRLISVAPMMDYTDRHDRYFLRLLAPQILLYTEMIAAPALLHGDVPYLLQYHPQEHPLALQLGGSDPELLSLCAKVGEDYGYDEINLNVGCPSDRVQSGRIGACLMLEPSLVADCVAAMKAAVSIPVTVKCRIGVDDKDSYEDLNYFIEVVAKAGCEVFIVHARKAWLSGLSPKENREIPPLRYEVVKQLKADFPQLQFILNGGLKTLTQVEEALASFDGVMIGREAYSNPYLLAELHQKFYAPDEKLPQREEIVERLFPYIEDQLSKNTRLSSITRHILGLFKNQKGANLWRRYLSEHAYRLDAGVDVLRSALSFVVSD